MNEEWLGLVNRASFAFRDLIGQEVWVSRTLLAADYSFVTATSLVLTMRHRIVGKTCEFQVKSTGTSLATTAGTSYIMLPLPAKGVAGFGVMTNDTTDVAVGIGHIDVTASRFYPPSQVASAETFTFAGWYEV